MSSRELEGSELSDDLTTIIKNDDDVLEALSETEPIIAIHGKPAYPRDPGDGLRFYRLGERLYISMTYAGAERGWYEVDRAEAERWILAERP